MGGGRQSTPVESGAVNGTGVYTTVESDSSNEAIASVYGSGLSVEFYDSNTSSLGHFDDSFYNGVFTHLFVGPLNYGLNQGDGQLIVGMIEFPLISTDTSNEGLFASVVSSGLVHGDDEESAVIQSTSDFKGKDNSDWVYYNTSLPLNGVTVPCDFYIWHDQSTLRCLYITVETTEEGSSIPSWASFDSVSKGIQLTGTPGNKGGRTDSRLQS